MKDLEYTCAQCQHEYRWHTKLDRIERCNTWECRCSGFVSSMSFPTPSLRLAAASSRGTRRGGGPVS